MTLSISKLGYYLLRATTWIMQRFPLKVHYVVSDLFFIVAYYVIRYRKSVVRENLANSFPQKTKQERLEIEKRFFRHFCDSFIETLYFDRIALEEARGVVRYTNADLLNKYMDQGRQVIVILGHYNNWEWNANWALHSPHRFYPIYKKLKNTNFEKFYYNLRSQFGAIPTERAETFRQLISDHQKGIPSMSAFLFDQTPRVYEIQHWVNFLNQDTPVILGAEKVAQKVNGVVVFMHSRKIKRGQYEGEYELITDQAKDSPKFEITDKCMALLEQQINDRPEFWLWSHKRWKHTREDVQ